MAELTAKLRAKFRRRHTAVPGIPSLLSRSSIRSSSGSHGSSLFRPLSLGSKRRSSGPYDPDQDHADEDGVSRLGSSRVSINDEVLDQQKSPHFDANGKGSGNGNGNSIPAHPDTKDGPRSEDAAQPAAVAAEDGVDGIVVAPTGNRLQTDQAHEAAHQDKDAEFRAEAQVQHHSGGPTETSSLHSSKIPSGPALAPGLAPMSYDTSSSSADVSSTDVDTITTMADPSIHLTAAPALTHAPAPAATQAALVAGADDAPSASVPDPLTVSARRLAIPVDPESLQPKPKPTPTPTGSNSNMPVQDRHPALRKLSSVVEQPSPDAADFGHNNIDDVAVAVDIPPHPQSQTQSQPLMQTLTFAPATANILDILPLPPAAVAPPAPAPAIAPAPPAATSVPTPTSPKKRNDANLRPMRTAPRTAGLGPPTPSRPLHIHLPPASFGGPNPNLSPGAVFHATNTAPTSPLRHSTLAPPSRPTPARRQSLLSNRQSTLIQTLLGASQLEDHHEPQHTEHLLPISGNMVSRKIWVKRPGASATLVTINEDDLVDDVREMILRKYANSLGRQFDAPDLTLRIRPNGNQQERLLGPEEPMARTLDAYFPSGQTIDDALLIDVPLRRTPRASPRIGPPHAPHIQYYVEDPRPPETAGDYFGPGALSALPVTLTAPSAGSGHSHAISVLSTGQVPQIPSPGGRRARDYRERPERPRLGRQHTSSPTLINLASGASHQSSIAQAAIAPHGMHTTFTSRPRSRTHSEASDATSAAPQPPSLPTPPPVEPASAVPQRIATPPPPRVASPRPKKSKKKLDHPMLPKGMLNGSVPPINVLIVEDNIINLKLLEAFVKRLKVRWSTAMNGRDAVTKWRAGGFHLVLMDIQLPIMSGLDATREIRRLERVNSIGVFSSAAASAPEEVKGEPAEKDRLGDKDLFKSPVIIVALTASSLQSDRHEALAAGCNDFLTKPVNFVWLERKVMEWGCMQALIDFDGWRQWKDFSAQQVDDRAAKAAALKAKSKKSRSSLSLTQAVVAGA